MADTATHLLAPVPPERAGERLDRWLAETMPEADGAAPGVVPLSRSRLKALVLDGHVRLGGQTITDPSRKIKPGEAYTVAPPEAIAAAPEAPAFPTHVVFAVSHLIVLAKRPAT